MNHLLFHLPWSLLSPSQKLAKSHNENQPVGTTEEVCTKKKNLPTKKFQQLLASAIYHLTSLAPEDPDMQVLRSISPNL